MRTLILTLLLLLLSAVPLSAQERYGGGTSCVSDSANPIIYQQIVAPYPRPPLNQWRVEYRALLEHEATHVEQMARYPTCAAMLAALTAGGADSLLAWEAEAGCAQMAVYVNEGGADPRDLFGVFVKRLRDKVGEAKSTPEIVAALTRVCPLVRAPGQRSGMEVLAPLPVGGP